MQSRHIAAVLYGSAILTLLLLVIGSAAGFAKPATRKTKPMSFEEKFRLAGIDGKNIEEPRSGPGTTT